MPLPAPPPLRPVLVDWAEPPVQRGSCRHCPSLQFFFSFLFFFLPRPQPFFYVAQGSKLPEKPRYNTTATSSKEPFYCVRIPLIQITIIDPASTKSSAYCSRQSLTLPLAASVLLLQLRLLPSVLLLHPYNTLIFYKLLSTNPQRIIALCASIFLPIVL